MAANLGDWQSEIDKLLQFVQGEALGKFRETSTDEERIHYIVNQDYLKKVPWIGFFFENCGEIHQKSVDKSQSYRDKGNKAFQQRKYEESVKFYSKAVLQAPVIEEATDDISLAYANTSAALFHLTKYEACLANITAARDNGYPTRLLHKLQLREAQCLLCLGRKADAHKCMQAAKQHIKESQDMITETFHKELSSFDQILQNTPNSHQRIKSSASDPVQTPDLSYGQNKVVTQATSALKMAYTEGKGRHLVATRAVSAGDTLIVEKPFAAVLLPDHYHSHCHHCFGQLDMLVIPCRRCTEVRYCSLECRGVSWTLYHHIECSYLNLLHSVGIAHLSLRVILVAGLPCLLEFRESLSRLDAEEELSGVKRLGGVREGGRYERDYLTVYDLMPHSGNMDTGDLFQYSLTACVLLKILQEAGWFSTPSDTSQNTKDMAQSCPGVTEGPRPDKDLSVTELYVGGLLLRHILQLVCNAHAITELQVTQATNLSLVETKSQVRVATAIYPTASLMNHSCDPTIISSFHRDLLVVRAIKPVTEGGEIYNCYGPHYKRMCGPERRQILREQYFFDCRCDPCQADSKQDAMFATYRCPKCGGSLVEEQAHVGCSRCGYHGNTLPYKERASVGKDLFIQGLERLEAHNITGAIDVLKKCHQVRKEILCQYHRDLAETVDCLARCYSITGDFQMSCEYLTESVSIVKSVYGPSSIEYANELQKYAEVLVSAGRLDTAWTVTNEALPIFRVHYGTSHVSVTELEDLRSNIQRSLNIL